MSRPRDWNMEARDPHDDEASIRCFIHQATIENLTRAIHTSRFYRLICAKDVLEEPDAIFQGWNREGHEDGLCYVGRPQDRPKDGIELPPQPNRCFFVFVMTTGKIDEWRWEDFCLTDEADYRRQFGDNWRKVWPRA